MPRTRATYPDRYSRFANQPSSPHNVRCCELKPGFLLYRSCLIFQHSSRFRIHRDGTLFPCPALQRVVRQEPAQTCCKSRTGLRSHDYSPPLANGRPEILKRMLVVRIVGLHQALFCSRTSDSNMPIQSKWSGLHYQSTRGSRTRSIFQMRAFHLTMVP